MSFVGDAEEARVGAGVGGVGDAEGGGLFEGDHEGGERCVEEPASADGFVVVGGDDGGSGVAVGVEGVGTDEVAGDHGGARGGGGGMVWVKSSKERS